MLVLSHKQRREEISLRVVGWLLSVWLSLSYFNGSNLNCFSLTLHQTSSSCPHWILSTVMAMVSSIRFYLACLVYQSVCFSRSETVFLASKALKTQVFAPHGVLVHLRVLEPQNQRGMPFSPLNISSKGSYVGFSSHSYQWNFLRIRNTVNGHISLVSPV